MPHVPGLAWLIACSGSGAAAVATWIVPFDFVGMPAPNVFMAFAGAAAGLIVQPPNISRRAMLLLAMAFTFFGAAGAVVLGEIPVMAWTRHAAPAIAGLLAFFAQALVPALRARFSREVQDRGSPEVTKGDTP